MKRLILATALILSANPAFAKEYIIKEVTDPEGGAKPYYFSPATLTIQPGDTVTFVNAQDDMHDVMFSRVPKSVNEMIMSEPFEKKGQKFSYKFTVPGTYEFHCHPHEELGMKGVLTVGTPSKAGETKKVSHHEMAQYAEAGGTKTDAMAAGASAGSGTVNAVDAGKRVVSITHEPIKSLGWPKMKMQFSVAPGVDLSAVKAGDNVDFQLKPEGKEDYIVTAITKK